MRFTKASVAALQLPAGKTDHFFWDDATPAFGVRLRGTKRTWIAQMRVHGRTQRRGCQPDRIGACQERSQEVFWGVDTRGAKDPAAQRVQARAQAANTVGIIIEQYLADREEVARPNTMRNLRRYLRQLFAPLHGRPIDGVTRRDVTDELNRLKKENGACTAKEARAALSAFFTWAWKAGNATGESNPVTLTNDPNPGAKPRDRVLVPAEIRAIWRALPVLRLASSCASASTPVAGVPRSGT
jgi:hypothetical protein